MGWTFPWSITAVRGTHVCLRKIDYPLIWKLLKEEGITHFNAAPTVNTLLCSADEAEKLAQPVRVTVAASPPTPYLFEQMVGQMTLYFPPLDDLLISVQSKLNLHPVHVYGLTETYGPITKGYQLPSWDALPPSEKFVRMARQGHGFVVSLPIRIIKTDLPEGVLEDVAKDGKEIGEIVFTGNICAKGYYKDPDATRKLFAGGALHSGDLAVWHPDGSAQILDRAKDIIISGKTTDPVVIGQRTVKEIADKSFQAARTYRRWRWRACSPNTQICSRQPWSRSRTLTGESGPRRMLQSRRGAPSRRKTSSRGRSTRATLASSWCPARSRWWMNFPRRAPESSRRTCSGNGPSMDAASRHRAGNGIGCGTLKNLSLPFMGSCWVGFEETMRGDSMCE
jgi:AMP-binding enzyme